jgi:fumarate reductase flavoprotein subunit
MLLKTTKHAQLRALFFCMLALAVGCDTETAALYNAGVYTGSAEGFRAPVTVFTTFSEDRIVGIFISKHAETIDTSHVAEGAWGDVEEVAPQVIRAIAEIPAAIVEKQSIAVDAISGATATSRAIKGAVEKCIEQAKR